MLIVPDSSVCIEWLADGPAAARFSSLWQDPDALLIPSVVIYEVTRWFLARKLEDKGQDAAFALSRYAIANLTPSVARYAAILAAECRLGMADAMILATARANNATLWTQDIDFEGLEGVRYFPKPA
jgi:predicted nucleic acid-binding protein